jgi:hypothetical protein
MAFSRGFALRACGGRFTALSQMRRTDAEVDAAPRHDTIFGIPLPADGPPPKALVLCPFVRGPEHMVLCGVLRELSITGRGSHYVEPVGLRR